MGAGCLTSKGVDVRHTGGIQLWDSHWHNLQCTISQLCAYTLQQVVSLSHGLRGEAFMVLVSSLFDEFFGLHGRYSNRDCHIALASSTVTQRQNDATVDAFHAEDCS